MLELRPTCEQCNKALPPASTDAMICSFECTYCRDCVDGLHNVCPNCGGGFTARPIRPSKDWRNGNTLDKYPATGKVTYKPVDLAEHTIWAMPLENLPPERR
jgi:hypothetical protein